MVVGTFFGMKAVQAVTGVVAELTDLVDVQVVAHITPPVHGPDGRENRALLREAIAMGATHVGGNPYWSDDPVHETHVCLEEAATAGVGVDLHTDETMDPSCLTVMVLADAVKRTGFPHPVAASHCVSLGVQPPDTQRRAAEALAEAGVSVISLPQTNLYLQGRGAEEAKPRGLTALAALYRAGVKVAAGGDNIQDPFNPLGRADPLEAASLFVSAGPARRSHRLRRGGRVGPVGVRLAPGGPGGGLPRGPCRPPRFGPARGHGRGTYPPGGRAQRKGHQRQSHKR